MPQIDRQLNSRLLDLTFGLLQRRVFLYRGRGRGNLRHGVHDRSRPTGEIGLGGLLYEQMLVSLTSLGTHAETGQC